MKLPKIHPIIAMTLKVILVTTAAVLVLAFVYEVCEPYIAQRQDDARKNAIADVFGDSFTVSGDSFVWEDATLTPMTNSASSQSDPNLPHGFAVEATTGGYAGEISLLVGVVFDADGLATVAGVELVEHSETAGYFASGDPRPFLAQFSGKQNDIVLNGLEGGVDAVSGATITSRAITNGVNRALSVVISYVDSIRGGESSEG